MNRQLAQEPASGKSSRGMGDRAFHQAALDGSTTKYQRQNSLSSFGARALAVGFSNSRIRNEAFGSQ